MTTEIISFRIKKELKDLAKKHRIDISRVAKEKVEEELEKLQKKERDEIFSKASDILADFTKEDFVETVRKGRESR